MRSRLVVPLLALCALAGCTSDDARGGAQNAPAVALFFIADATRPVDADAYGRVHRRVASGSPGRIASEVVRLLAVGPTAAEQTAGLQATAPAARFLRSVKLIDRRLIVDFKPSLRGGATGISTATGDAIFYGSISRSLFALNSVEEIELRIDGSCAQFTAYVQGGTGCHRIRRP